MFRTIDDFLLAWFQRYVDWRAPVRNATVRGAMPFHGATFFFAGSCALFLLAVGDTIVAGRATLWLIGLLPMQISIILRVREAEFMRQHLQPGQPNAMRRTSYASRLVLLVLLLLSTLLLGVEPASLWAVAPLLNLGGFWTYWLGLNLLCCEIPRPGAPPFDDMVMP